MGNLEGLGLFHRGLRETGREGFWEWSVCFCGALRREAGGRLLFWEFQIYVKRALEMEHLSLCRGTRRVSSFSGGSERYAKRALEIEHLSLCWGSVRGTWKGGGVLFWGLC
jgi:hypothetical protein